MDPILAFYKGEPTPQGLRLADVWEWGFDQLEDAHDYIQWIFPLDAESRANPDAPLLTEDTALAFAWDDVLRDRVEKSFAMMLGFYGLERLVLPRKKITIIRATTFDERRGVWLGPDNHNHLRLTRILRSLRLLGMQKDAAALGKILDDIARTEGRDVISEDTVMHWRRALKG